MEKKKIVVFGYGERGAIYAGYSLYENNEFEVVAIIDNKESRRELARTKFDCPIFEDYHDFIDAKIASDIVVVSTQDSDHLEHAVALMQAGYDLLLEKPIATNYEDCLKIYEASVKYGRKVVVCHVLRYTPFYRTVKDVINSGALGEIITISASENVGYYHQSHSFVRGPWRNSIQSSPMILAKCCHDMDILRWLIDCKCVEISSFGSLSYFTKENAPEGSASVCSECQVKDCIYRAQDVYVKYGWMAGYFTTAEKTPENIRKYIKGTQYDKCVFKTDNDVVDHQVTIMKFEGEKTAMHQMTAFSKEIYRDIKIHGTKAELYGHMEDEVLEIRPFVGEVKQIPIVKKFNYGNHGGGDAGLMHDLYLFLNGETPDGISLLEVSLDSHKMSFTAEQSRVEGKNIKL